MAAAPSNETRSAQECNRTMADPNQRTRTPILRSEMERRWALIRAEMAEAGVDALIVEAANNLAGTAGHYRWATGLSVASSYLQAMLIPRDGPFTLVMHGDHEVVTDLNDKDPNFPGVGKRLTSWGFPGVQYCSSYEGKMFAQEIKRAGYKKLAVVCPNTMYNGFFRSLSEELGHPQFVDLTSRIDVHKANKSPAEIEMIRAAAKMQDDILDQIKDHIKPGVYDYEVMSRGHYMGMLAGSETGYFLGSSAPPGQPTVIRRAGEHGRRMNQGDVMYFQCENTGPGGYFVHAGRFYVLGRAPQELQDLFGAMVEAQDFTVGMLQIGADCREIFKEYNNYMIARGFPPEKRVHCHGQGYDNVEPPLVRSDESMKIGKNMNIGLHPAIARKDIFVTSCDNYLIGADGKVERLHKLPRKIYELN
jgi:Xaa-Pro aminopeptidase